MKRVTIVTWTGVCNYGTCLQSYALQCAVEKLGYQVNILDRIRYESLLRIVFNAIKSSISRILADKETKKYRVERFHRKFQHIVRPKQKIQLQRIVNQTDVFISGSDQIWNTAHRYSPMMFLDFAGNKKRISYATSIGTADVPDRYKKIVNQHLQKYQHISVRENTAVNALKALTKREDILQVLDPTFLLSDKEWHKFGEHALLPKEIPSDYLFCYFVGDNEYYTNQVLHVIRHSGLKHVIIVTLKGRTSLDIEDAMLIHDAGPVEFVYLIENAVLVCTDSFHATAISINYGKPFVELLRFSDEDTGSQNSRIYDLLTHYGLSERIYSDEHTRWIQPIDYKEVHEILGKDRETSWQYLKNGIEQ